MASRIFGDGPDSPFYKRVTLTHDKGLVHAVGGILIDDRPYHGASQWLDQRPIVSGYSTGMDSRLVWTGELVDYLKLVAQAIKVLGNSMKVPLNRRNPAIMIYMAQLIILKKPLGIDKKSNHDSGELNPKNWSEV